MAKPKKPQAEAGNSVILTKKEAADFLRCTVRYIERQIRAGRLRACKPTGKLVRLYRHDLDAFLESGATIGGEA
jgi:excisionase family DNA binding protein